MNTLITGAFFYLFQKTLIDKLERTTIVAYLTY